MEETDEVRQVLKEFQDLLKSPGWARLNEYLQGQIDVRDQALRTPVHLRNGEVHAASDEFLRGELAALELFGRMPDILITQAEISIRQENENDSPRREDSRRDDNGYSDDGYSDDGR